MMMVELTSVPGAALPVSELAEHLRLARGFSDDGSQDASLESCLRAALSAIEARIGKALFERRFALTLMAWHDADAHVLPLAPVVAVDSVKLITRAGAETLVAPEVYVLRGRPIQPPLAAHGRVLPAPRDGRDHTRSSSPAGFAFRNGRAIPAQLRSGIDPRGRESGGRTSIAQAGISLCRVRCCWSRNRPSGCAGRQMSASRR